MKLKILFYLSYYFFSCLVSYDIVAQNKVHSIAEIEEKISEANHVHQALEYDKAYELYLKIIEYSKEQQYSKGLTEGYLGAANCLFPSRQVGKSTGYLLLAKEEAYAKGNPQIMCDIYYFMGLNLHNLQLAEKAKKYYDISTQYAEKIKDPELKNRIINRNSLNIGDLYQLLENYEDAFVYYYKSFNQSGSMGDLETRTTASLSLTDLYMLEGNQDSVYKYITISLENFYEIAPAYQAMVKRMNGLYHFSEGNYQEAIDNLKDAEAYNKLESHIDPTIYDILAKTYTKFGQPDSASFYYKKYLDFEKENKFKTMKNNETLIEIYQDTESKLKKTHLRNTALISLAILISVSTVAFLMYRKKIRKKAQITQELRSQISASDFDEIVGLAKDNSPNFFTRFIEIYPEFYHYFLNHYPDLTQQELVLCMYIKLNFNTKEIAEYTFTSIRTVQNKKYRLRKKIDLDSKIDLNIWIQKAA